jgi:hypothetical protein
MEKQVCTSLRINLSKHQNASASSLSSTIMGEHKSLIPNQDEEKKTKNTETYVRYRRE